MRMGILSRGGINATCTAGNNFRHAYRQILRKIDNRQAPGTDHSNFHNNLSFQIVCT